jgi:hypothetical protein
MNNSAGESMVLKFKDVFLLVSTVLFLVACDADETVHLNSNDGSDAGTGDLDTDSDGDGDADSDADSDTDTDTDTGLGGEIIPPMGCDDCVGVGSELENMACSIELCDSSILLNQTYTSPTVVKQTQIDKTRIAVEHFGDMSNGLAPLMNDSYTLMATGPAEAPIHHVELQGTFGTKFEEDPFAPPQDTYNKCYDVMEWRLHLKAPLDAAGFQIHYSFFSTEYDTFIGREFNDKFYIFIESPSLNGGERTVTNFTKCRDPDEYRDFTCSSDQAAQGLCIKDKDYCYVAINTALSECCWYQGCPNKTEPNTNIDGTGYECGTEANDNEHDMCHKHGSTTGWLRTEWPLQPGEEFDLIFHIHDTADGMFDSEVILDKFVFVRKANAGTTPV